MLKRFHLAEFPPYDRKLTKAEMQHLLVLPQAEVPHAGIFSANGKYNPQKALRVFRIWKRKGYKEPSHTTSKLQQFLRTRGKRTSSNTREEVLRMCEETLIDEANSNCAVRLFLTPYDDGLAEKKRRQALIKACVLTNVNAPSHVAPPCPKITDPGWQMLKVEVLETIKFPDVMVDWLTLFTDDFSTLMRKAQGSWSSGKAYAIKYRRIDEYLYIHARVGQSFSNASTKAYNVMLVFQFGETAVQLVYATCFQCVGGANSGWCHHVVMLLIGLMQFRMGIIKVGQYNGGDRAWGQGRLLIDMPSLTSHQIALLFPSQHALRLFPGL